MEHLVKEISSSSDKEMWEFVKRKRPHPAKGDGNEEESVEHEGPPTKKSATAKAVAAALNKGFEMQRKGKEKKTDTPMETIPQNLMR